MDVVTRRIMKTRTSPLQSRMNCLSVLLNLSVSKSVGFFTEPDPFSWDLSVSHCRGGHASGYVHGVHRHLRKDQPWASPLTNANTRSSYLSMAVALNPTTSCLPSRHHLPQSHPRHVQISLGSQQFYAKKSALVRMAALIAWSFFL